MIEMRPSKAEEIPAQKRLWKQVFGDSDAYVSAFYERCAGAEDVLVLLDGGALRSMLALPPMTVALPDGKRAKSAYVYALCTDPEARGQGYGRMLLRYADFYLKEQGADCVTVVPAEAGLHRFFATVDFTECFATWKQEFLSDGIGLPCPGDRLEPVEAAEYGALRERLLEGTFHAVYGERLMAFQAEISRLSGAGLYRVLAGGAEGCAAVECGDGESVVLKELLLPPELLPRGAALVKARHAAQRYDVRTPAFWEGPSGGAAQPFAMIKWFDPNLRRKWLEERRGYFGLGFD